jgi:hypothetical protein
MSDVVQHAHGDFWQAPLATPAGTAVAAGLAMVQTCGHCGAEFVMGAGFCHVCGNARQVEAALTSTQNWTRYVQFHQIKRFFGLSTASLMAFLLGLGCTLAALLVGFIFSANTVLDWQAVQIWRIEWLLSAVACFVAGILLRRPVQEKTD